MCTFALLCAQFPTCMNMHPNQFCGHKSCVQKILIYEGLLVCQENMAVKNFVFREYWVGSEVDMHLSSGEST